MQETDNNIENYLPFVSVVVPCRNEEKYIEGLINSITSQDYPKRRLEVFIVDGMSDDNTRQILTEKITSYSYISLLDNPKKIIPTALNIGIKASKGEFVVRLDVHCLYPQNYISTLIEKQKETNADDIGGVLDTQPGNDTLKAKAISLAMSNPFGVGNAVYRTLNSGNNTPFEVDTVPFGCYKREIFDKIGLYDETFLCNEDNDFNDRLLKSNGKIFLIPNLKITYFARENYLKLWKMFYRYSFYMPYVNKKLKQRTKFTRYVPSVFVCCLLGPLIFFYKNNKIRNLSFITFFTYCCASLIAAFKIAKGNIVLIPYIIGAFIISHCSYGIGYLAGLINFVVLDRKVSIKSLNTTR